jgi:hypothetical protein
VALPLFYRYIFTFAALVVVVNARLEHAFVNAANRAYPVSGNIFKRCSRCDSVFRITFCGIICVAARIAKIFFHFDNLLPYYVSFKTVNILAFACACVKREEAGSCGNILRKLLWPAAV